LLSNFLLEPAIRSTQEWLTDTRQFYDLFLTPLW
jgi:hypothetical protein